MTRSLIFLMAGLLLIGLVAATSIWVSQIFWGQEQQASDPLDIGGDFTLTGHEGRPVSSTDYRGKYLLVFFGYTFCPDICPVTLQSVSLALDALTPEQAGQVQPFFISADPDRDTPDVLAQYVSHFHPSIIGLTGEEEKLKAVAKDYRAFFARAPTEDPDFYLVNHSTFLYLMGPDGAFIRLFRHDVSVEELRTALAEKL